ncbi:copper-binding protein [Methylobacterium sp. 2A]|uniref:copper-binding protein n=1 Tax=Methylobacterium sp. 2A TaxID=2603816 RepID=UPI0013542C87|nr:copper-binding protein [Methylobacterium sp. 2A]MWV25127.1 copper-binding protein [Methylobacterium sp. 2A]
MFNLRPKAGTRTLLATAALLLAGAAQAQTGKPSPMGDMPGMSGNAGATNAKSQTANGTGTVTAVNAGQNKVTLNHEPIPALSWPAMEMELAAAPSVDLTKIKPGAKVQFTLSSTKGSYTVQSLTPMP